MPGLGGDPSDAPTGRADVAPEGGQVDGCQQATAVVTQALIRNQRTALGNRGLQAECTQGTCRITWQVNARTRVCPCHFLLDHVGRKATLPKGSCSAETGDTRADHENAQTGTEASTAPNGH